tara:strand:+ start:384 stop:491 length:108 start_codon:yes stop_codon:yes gene_type:complete
MDKDFLNKYLSDFLELMRPDDFILGAIGRNKKDSN